MLQRNYLFQTCKELGILCVFFGLFLSCRTKNYQVHFPTDSKKIIVTGKILNYDPSKSKDTIILYKNEFIYEENSSNKNRVSPTGEFLISFESSYPHDAFLHYYSSIPFFAYPGDSIYVELDARDTARHPPNHVKYSGDHSVENQALLSYLISKSYSEEAMLDKFKKMEEMDFKSWINYLDSVKKEDSKNTEIFLQEYSPPSVVLNWITAQEEEMYQHDIWSYLMRKSLNGQQAGFKNLIDKYLAQADIETEFLINTSYSQFLTMLHLNKHQPNQFRWHGQLGDFIRDMDSASLSNILKETVSLTQQLVLASFVNNILEAGKISFFEKNAHLIQNELRELMLLEALQKKYADIKDGIYTPISLRRRGNSSTQILDGKLIAQTGRNLPVNITEISQGTILDTAIQRSQAKVLYVDLWSIECGASLVHLPSMEKFRQPYEENELECIYLCLDSQEWHWKNQINKHNLKGQHFLLNPSQAHILKEKLNLTGAPFYLIINKDGTLYQEGPELWPKNPIVKPMIDSLLNLHMLN